MSGRQTIRLSSGTLEQEKPFSYVMDASEIKLEETSSGKKQSWIQALPLGEYEHPLWGTLDITKERVKQFAANVNENVRGIQLDIDYEHKDGPDGGRAAGWVLKAEDRGDDGLWILVEWTDKAATAIEAGEYKYFSPEFDWEWTHPKTKKTYENVLFGGALTNRPFLKDILPVNLSDLLEGIDLGELFDPPEGKYDQQQAHYGPASSSTRRCANCAFFRKPGSCLIVDGEVEEDHVSDYFQAIYTTAYYFKELPQGQQDKIRKLFGEPKEKVSERKEERVDLLKKLREVLGLKEDASEEVLLAKVKSLAEASPGKKLGEVLGMTGEVSEDKLVEEVKSLKDRAEGRSDATVTTLEKTDPQAAKELREVRMELRETRAERRLEEWERGTVKLEEGAKPRGVLPPVLHDDIKTFMVSLSDGNAESFSKIITGIVKTGLVNLSEVGSTTRKKADENDDDPVDVRFVKKLNEVREAAKDENNGKGISMGEARKRLAASDPDLVKEWRDSRRPVASNA